MNRPPTLFLHVEDNDDHAFLVEQALSMSGHPCELERVERGDHALARLRAAHESTSVRIPDVVLLDIKLPKVDGLQVLRSIKSDPALSSTPVVMLTTSDSTRDRADAYAQHANSYLVKPWSFAQFCDLLNEVLRYWSVRNLPAPRPPPAGPDA